MDHFSLLINGPFKIGICLAIVAYIITTLVVPLTRRLGFSLNAIDKPDFRKIHKVPLVRLGGVALYVALVSSLSLISFLIGPNKLDLLSPISTSSILICITLFFLLGLLDDFYTISPFYRLIIQCGFALYAWSSGISITSLDLSILGVSHSPLILTSSVSMILTLIWIVGLTNAVNWFDGMDGLLSGISSIILVGIIMISFSLNNNVITYLAFSLLGCCLGFLLHNLSPTIIIMGDSGSFLLGSSISIFTILGLSIDGQSLNIHSFLILLVPIFDMTFVILNRLRKGRSPFYPDRSHLHHRLLNLGYTQTQVLSIIFISSIFFVGISVNTFSISLYQLALFYVVIAFIVSISRIVRVKLNSFSAHSSG